MFGNLSRNAYLHKVEMVESLLGYGFDPRPAYALEFRYNWFPVLEGFHCIKKECRLMHQYLQSDQIFMLVYCKAIFAKEISSLKAKFHCVMSC